MGEPEKRIQISVVIPVKNGDSWLEETLPAIINQTLFDRCEIIVIDSGSTDNTLTILKKYPVRVIHIDPSTFNHGTTRMLGVREAKGEFVIFTVQDAKPVNNQWMENLLCGFIHDGVAGVCGQQIVPHHKDKNPVEWFRPQSTPQLVELSFNSKEFNELNPQEQLNYCRWDDVNAAYRKKVLEAIPFRDVNFAEDVLWAKDALLAGHSIVYTPFAPVEHYHLEEPEFTFKRNFTIRYHFYKYFGVKPVIGTWSDQLIRKLRIAKTLWKEKGISFAEKSRWLNYNLKIQKERYASNAEFLRALALGEQALDGRHKQLCGTPPQASKPKMK